MAMLILEIGTEEIPAAFAKLQEKSIETQMDEAMQKHGLSHGSVQVFSTPRRLSLKMEGIAPFQEKKEEIVTGPSVKAAWDENGVPTKAMAGFCHSQGISPEEAVVLNTPKGDYVGVKKEIGGRPAKEVLEEILPEVLARLPFPKKMRWGNHDLHYPRPAHWILALLDDEVLDFSFGHLNSGNQTYGHRVHGKGPFIVNSAANYEKILKDKCQITLDANSRRNLIRQKGDELARDNGGEIVWKESLLDEVTGLVEHPYPIMGKFSEKYLQIPEEVLLTSMEKHQKCFGVRDKNKKLLPCFLTVANLASKDENTVRHGWERVLKARLEDAAFFWKEDSGTPLSAWQDKLEKVIFIGPLGSMADKARRVSKLCVWLAEKTGLANAKDAARAGELSKMDLVSSMVGEFDTLQGIMGGIYAKNAGENAEVATAIQEQYLPAGPDTPIPATSLGALLSLADKADTITGCFGLGKIPTGTADPDGLRRASLGIIRIMLDKKIQIPLREIFEKALSLYGERKWKFEKATILDKIQSFMTSRLRNWFVQEGYDNLVVDAVLDRPFQTSLEAELKIQSLQEFYKSGEAGPVSAICKRLENIVKKSDFHQPVWKPELLAEESEQKLGTLLTRFLPEMDSDLASRDYAGVLRKTVTLQQPLDEFFEKTMILCEDQGLRQNRLSLLQAILERIGKIATFGKLQI